ncbi:MAG: MacB family efflux pump subunit [Rhodospirillaceae bacterium]|nr:MacB family efflux pump subunit [Rhodospirillaceae bacterium]
MNLLGSSSPVTAAAVSQQTDTPIIGLRDITKTYTRGDFAVEVLHGISIDIYPGEFVAIMGASGSGKSTLMNLIGCLDRPTTGSYQFAGQEVAELDPDERALLRRESFGFIFQQYNLLATSNAVENVEVPAVYAGLTHQQRVARAEELLTSLGLGERLDHKPSQLSGGQQQRVSIARALMNGGAVILADEPTGALDSKSGEDVMHLLHDLNAKGHTILLITHDANVAKRAKRVIEIRDGEIVSDTGRSAAVSEHVIQPPSVDTHGSADGVKMPDIMEAGKMAFRALRTNLLRTLLTLLGIIIGVASVVAMLAIGNGAKQEVLDRMSSMGTNLLLVRPGAANLRMADGVRATLTMDDAKALSEVPNVSEAVPEYAGNVTVRFGNADAQTQFNATTPGYTIARDWDVDQGAFFTEEELNDYAPVAVIGTTVMKSLFGNANPIGQYVIVNNIPFLIIGIMHPKGANNFGQDMDDIIFAPFTTGALRVFGQRYARSITVAVEDLSRIDETQAAVSELLKARHGGIEDFQIRNMASVIEARTETQDTLTILLGSIAAISLLVGGIGVMNIMLVSVTERTREIGVRMATGARKINILLQFNTEALVVCAIGGFIGVVIGLLTAFSFASFGKPVLYSAGPVILAFTCAFATGLLFGYLPARKAANLDPVVALGAD